jgi:hypothetical protein
MRRGYEVRLRGRLSPWTQQAFEGFTARDDGGDTILRGEVRDDAALFGLISTVEALGLSLLEVRPVGDTAQAPPSA